MQIRRGEIKLFLFGGYLRVHIKNPKKSKKKQPMKHRQNFQMTITKKVQKQFNGGQIAFPSHCDGAIRYP